MVQPATCQGASKEIQVQPHLVQPLAGSVFETGHREYSGDDLEGERPINTFQIYEGRTEVTNIVAMLTHAT